MPSFQENRGLWILLMVVVSLAILAGGYLLVLSAQGAPELVIEEPQAREAQILEGTYVCLPRTDGNKTTECTPGLKVGNDYYALDLAILAGAGVTTNFTNGTNILAAGVIVPIEEISSEQWDVYSVKGIMAVEEVARP